MTIKCFFGDYTSHANEKKMLEQFLSQLQPVWGNSSDWIYVIYNTMWNGQEIDLVCITQNSIIVADFKNYSGALTGQENGEWIILTPSNENLAVKGGGQINPFVQIRKNKYAVMDWLKNNDLLVNDNIGHTSGMIVFTEISQLSMTLSHSVNQWFHVTDLPHVAEKIQTVHSTEINLAETEVETIVQLLNLQPYVWTPSTPVVAKYSPFQNKQLSAPTRGSIDYSALAQKIAASSTKEPPQAGISQLRSIYIPLVVTTILCAIAAYAFLIFFLNNGESKKQVVNHLVPESVQKISDKVGFNKVFDSKGIKTFNTDITDEFIKDTQRITNRKDDEDLWNIFQLQNHDNQTIYGFKIGKSTLKEIKPHLRKLDKVKEPNNDYRANHIFQVNTSSNIPEIKNFNDKFPTFKISDLESISLNFDKSDKLNAVIFSISSRTNGKLLNYTRRYIALGYTVLEGKLNSRLGDEYAILKRGENEYIVIRDKHMDDLHIMHTNKENFEEYGQRFLKTKGSNLYDLERKI